MELHIFYSEHNLLRVSWGRFINEESLRRHFDLLIANEHYPRDLRIISSTDVEEVGFSLTHENMNRIAALREQALAEYDSVCTAIYNIKPVPAAYVSFFSEFFDSPKSRMKLFSNEKAALSWLLGGVDPGSFFTTT